MAQSEIPLRVLLAGAAIAVVAAVALRSRLEGAPPISIGVLVRERERSDVAVAAVLAARELSTEDGSDGRTVRTLVRETHGDPATAAAVAERLIRDEGIAAIVIAGSPSECASVDRIARRSLTPVLSVRPTLRLDESPTLLDLAGLPNQRMVPAVAWAIRSIGTKVMLVSTAGPLQRVTHALVRDQVLAAGAEIVGECIIPAGRGDSHGEPAVVSSHAPPNQPNLAAAADAVVRAAPTLIIAAVDDRQAAALGAALRVRGIEAPAVPTLHLGLTDTDIATIDTRPLVGDFIVSSCIASSTNAARQEFGRRIASIGATAAIGEVTEAAYAATLLIGRAARTADPADHGSLAASLVGVSVAAPSHSTFIDPIGRAAWVRCGVGRIERGGAVVEAWIDECATRPQAWPLWRSREEWVALARGEMEPAPKTSPNDEVVR